MASKSRLPAPKHLQTVVEWRYPKAHRYWDDCGKVIATIETAFPGLACQGLEPDGFKFAGLSNGVTGAVFYWDKASITQVGQGDAALPDAAGRFWPLVQTGLGTTVPSRIGHRTWMCYETRSLMDAVRWLDGFSLWEFASGARSFGAPRQAGCVLRAQLEPGGRRLRLGCDTGTMTLKAREYHGVIVDVDIAIETPDAVAEDVREFLSWNLQFLRETVDPLFRGR